MRLAPHLVGIHDDRGEPEGGQLARDIEGGGAGLQADRGSWRQLVLAAETREPLGGRGHGAPRHPAARIVLDHEYALSAVHVETNVVGFHRPVLLALNIWGSVRMTPWCTADLIAVRGGPPLVFIDTVWWTPDGRCRKESTCRRVTPRIPP